jgi:hypothetical protein
MKPLIRNATQTWVLCIIGITLAAFLIWCVSAENLEFEVLIEKAPFLKSDRNSTLSAPLIIIASADEIIPPAPGIEFSQAMLEELAKVDYQSHFVILHLVGNLNENGLISQIVRRGNRVRITLNSYSVGPGNYELEAYTMPYQLTLVSKGKHLWNRKIIFKAKVKGEGLWTELQSFLRGDSMPEMGWLLPGEKLWEETEYFIP